MVAFGDTLLGKGVVVAKDTPNFIGNHIALYGVARTLEALAAGRYTIEEIDAITGPAIGRPGSATFRTMDIAGIDVLGARDAQPARAAARGDAIATFVVPPLVDADDRTRAARREDRQGVLRAAQGRGGESEIWTLDRQTLEYRPKQSARIASIEAGKSIDDLAERVRMLFHARDKAGEFLRATLAPTLVYTARVTPDIAIRSTTSIA